MKKLFSFICLCVLFGCHPVHEGTLIYEKNEQGYWQVKEAHFYVKTLDRDSIEYFTKYMNNLPKNETEK